MSIAIARRFVRVGERPVHYRVAGKGPVALLVHQSPRSSAEYVALITRLAVQYTVIAPDNPGNGLSDPLPEGARSVEDYGNALADFLTAIGVKRVLLYGFHTGAAIGLAFAAKHRKRVAVAVLNGVPVPDRRKVDAHVSRYLLPFEPSWDGAHLVWAWSRLREQTIFYPWFSDADADRVAFTPPAGDALFDACLEFFRAGDNYRHAYEAAFRVPTQRLVTALKCPAVIVSARWDPLFEEMEGLRVPDHVERVRLGIDPAESVPVIQRAFADHASAADVDLSPEPGADRGVVDGLFYRAQPGAGRPLVLIHDHHDDSSGADIAAGEAAGPRPTIAIDLPGHGESVTRWQPNLADNGQIVHDALTALGLRDAHLCGVGLGARVAATVTRPGKFPLHYECRPVRLTAAQHANGAALIEDFLAPREHAGRLIGAWRMARDGALFDPWCDPVPAAARRPSGDLNPDSLHRRALAALKSMRSWRASWAAIAPD